MPCKWLEYNYTAKNVVWCVHWHRFSAGVQVPVLVQGKLYFHIIYIYINSNLYNLIFIIYTLIWFNLFIAMLMFSTFLYIKWLILQPGQRSANVSMQTKLLGESWWFDVENFNTQLLISANRLLSPRANWNTGTAPARTQLRPQPTRPTMYAMNAGSAAWTVPMMDQMYGSEDCAPEGCQIFAFSTFFGDVCACLLWWRT